MGDEGTSAEFDDREQRILAREHAADLRDVRADARERLADERDRLADQREAAANEREHRLDEDAREQASREVDVIGRFQDSLVRA